DFTRNGSVGSEDYVWWRSHGGTEQQYDDWVANFGTTFNPGSAMGSAQVPEPASCLMIVLGAIAFTARRNRYSRPLSGRESI
ncbi:MAG TPA: PEP-CTERM sorting domain-containing protein, partial [Lacipirellulaceae bacterium]|nr:PEP-CTERM sorting domain-containing protein [Lacipirellulaceae bacterium]